MTTNGCVCWMKGKGSRKPSDYSGSFNRRDASTVSHAVRGIIQSKLLWASLWSRTGRVSHNIWSIWSVRKYCSRKLEPMHVERRRFPELKRIRRVRKPALR